MMCLLNGRAWFQQVSSDGTRMYHYGFDTQGDVLCTCPSFHYQKGTQDGKCKHIRSKLEYLSELKPMANYYLKSNLQVINDIFYDPRNKEHCGYPVGSLTNLFGESRKNKSIAAIQFALDAAQQMKKNVLFIHTEGMDGFFQTEPWVTKFNERFKTDFSMEHWYFDVASYYFDMPKYGEKHAKTGEIRKFSYDLSKYWKIIKEKDDAKARVIALRTDSLFTLHLLTGYPCEMKPTTGGKFGLNPNPSWVLDSFWKSPLFDIVHSNNIGAIVLDSVSTPMKGLFMGDQMKYPARTDAIAAILIPLDKIVANRGCVGFTVHHGTRNVTMPDAEKAYGGAIVQYSHKFEILFQAGKAKRNDTRTLIRKRHPALPEQNNKYVKDKGKQYIRISNKGVFDFKDE